MPYDLEKIKKAIAEALPNPKVQGPKHWFGAELPHPIYEGLITYAKENKVTVGQLILHALGCFFQLKEAAKTIEAIAKIQQPTPQPHPAAPKQPKQQKGSGKRQSPKTERGENALTVAPTESELRELEEIQ